MAVPLLTLATLLGAYAAWGRHTSRSSGPHTKTAEHHSPVAATSVQLYGYELLSELPHDPGAFTQGLQHDRLCSPPPGACKDIFWESTGMYGQSEIREVDLLTGKVLRSKALLPTDFGEGLTKLGDRLYQVNWQVGKTYSYDPNDFESYTTLQSGLSDGWGLTTDGGLLVFSDGSDTLTWKDPKDMATVKSVRVTDDGRGVRFLNELEWVDDEVWANVWQTECIARIDPSSGAVRGWILMHGLRHNVSLASPNQRPPMDVLNGIAYDSSSKRLFVTGKYWPKLLEVKVTLKSANATPDELATARKQCII